MSSELAAQGTVVWNRSKLILYLVGRRGVGTRGAGSVCAVLCVCGWWADASCTPMRQASGGGRGGSWGGRGDSQPERGVQGDAWREHLAPLEVLPRVGMSRLHARPRVGLLALEDADDLQLALLDPSLHVLLRGPAGLRDLAAGGGGGCPVAVEKLALAAFLRFGTRRSGRVDARAHTRGGEERGLGGAECYEGRVVRGRGGQGCEAHCI